jgi:TRAP-type mannitol/chloroaromatic compound transport system permease small subunit
MIIRTYIRTVDAINEWIGRTVMWLFLALTASVLIDMIKRYLTGASTVWAFDINYMIYAVNFMLAGGFCLLHEKHVRVDAFYVMMPIRWRGCCSFL